MEFSAILGFPLHYLLVMLNYSRDMSSQCCCFLCISEEHISTIVVSDEVDLMSLISYFQRENGQALETYTKVEQFSYAF